MDESCSRKWFIPCLKTVPILFTTHIVVYQILFSYSQETYILFLDELCLYLSKIYVRDSTTWSSKECTYWNKIHENDIKEEIRHYCRRKHTEDELYAAQTLKQKTRFFFDKSMNFFIGWNMHHMHLENQIRTWWCERYYSMPYA